MQMLHDMKKPTAWMHVGKMNELTFDIHATHQQPKAPN